MGRVNKENILNKPIHSVFEEVDELKKIATLGCFFYEFHTDTYTVNLSNSCLVGNFTETAQLELVRNLTSLVETAGWRLRGLEDYSAALRETVQMSKHFDLSRPDGEFIEAANLFLVSYTQSLSHPYRTDKDKNGYCQRSRHDSQRIEELLKFFSNPEVTVQVDCVDSVKSIESAKSDCDGNYAVSVLLDRETEKFLPLAMPSMVLETHKGTLRIVSEHDTSYKDLCKDSENRQGSSSMFHELITVKDIMALHIVTDSFCAVYGAKARLDYASMIKKFKDHLDFDGRYRAFDMNSYRLVDLVLPDETVLAVRFLAVSCLAFFEGYKYPLSWQKELDKIVKRRRITVMLGTASRPIVKAKGVCYVAGKPFEINRCRHPGILLYSSRK